eukprot:scaffold18269_cov71-Phaeocystis_antarctica.AAC.5
MARRKPSLVASRNGLEHLALHHRPEIYEWEGESLCQCALASHLTTLVRVARVRGPWTAIRVRGPYGRPNEWNAVGAQPRKRVQLGREAARAVIAGQWRLSAPKHSVPHAERRVPQPGRQPNKVRHVGPLLLRRRAIARLQDPPALTARRLRVVERPMHAFRTTPEAKRVAARRPLLCVAHGVSKGLARRPR